MSFAKDTCRQVEVVIPVEHKYEQELEKVCGVWCEACRDPSKYVLKFTHSINNSDTKTEDDTYIVETTMVGTKGAQLGL